MRSSMVDVSAYTMEPNAVLVGALSAGNTLKQTPCLDRTGMLIRITSAVFVTKQKQLAYLPSYCHCTSSKKCLHCLQPLTSFATGCRDIAAVDCVAPCSTCMMHTLLRQCSRIHTCIVSDAPCRSIRYSGSPVSRGIQTAGPLPSNRTVG